MPITETAREVLQEALAREQNDAALIAESIASLHKRAEAELMRHYASKKRIEELKAALKD